MSEEEKKAYKFYKECNENDLSAFEYFSEESKKQIKYMETILNLIEKQNNRLEQLEKENNNKFERIRKYEKTLENLQKDTIWKSELKENYIPKSIIKEKIDKLEDSLWEKGYEDEKSYAIKVLKKILEGEKNV